MSTTIRKPKPQKVEARVTDDLPEGWLVPSVGQILNVNYGKGLKEANRKPGNVSVYGSNGVVGKHATALTHGPTVIIGRKGTVGAVHFSLQPCWPIDTTYYIDEFHELYPEYVAFALRNLTLGTLDTSTTIPGLNRHDLYAQEIPLAPLAEQKHIVAKIEELLTQVNTARTRLAKVAQVLKRLRQAVLAAVCSGRLTADWREKRTDLRQVVLPADESRRIATQAAQESLNTPEFSAELADLWIWASIHDACERVIDYRGRTPPVTDHGIPHIRTTNIRSGRMDWHTEKFVSEATYGKYMTRGIPQVGDVLFTMEGPLGEAAVIRENGKFSLAQRILLLRGHPGKIDGGYLAWILMSSQVRAAIDARATGSTVKGIAYKRLRFVQLPVPPYDEQQEIARRIEALFAHADAIEKQIEAATKRTEKLTQAILAKAFRGELVPTEAELARREGRSYEPASAFLKRIRASHERTAGRTHHGSVRRRIGTGARKGL